MGKPNRDAIIKLLRLMNDGDPRVPVNPSANRILLRQARTGQAVPGETFQYLTANP